MPIPNRISAPYQISGPVTITYDYDPLYRLTEANYSNGDYYHYSYDQVGNRLSQETQLGGLPETTTYLYDDANRLTDVNGITYTWDDNGNLLDDGVNAYTYDTANRLKTLTGPSVNASYSYNGLGDRHQETMNGNTTTFTMDLNTGLTQVLSDGRNNYIYGLDRIAQMLGETTEYFLGDALGSVRQMADSSAEIIYARAYDPYGVVTATLGSSQTGYGYTGEYSGDYNELVYLRARFYTPGTGSFLTRDPSRLENNLYLYALANPVNRTDPTGLVSGLLGPEMFALCFDFHSLLMGQPPMVTVEQALIVCRAAFQKDAWNPAWFDFSGDLPQSAHDLMGWYLYEQGDSHLWFDGDQPLTKELAKSTLINSVRMRYYFGHGDTSGKVEQRFGYTQFMRSIIIDSKNVNKLSLPISFFLGSFYYQVRTLPNDRVGFRIDNVTSLGSGTHMVGRYDDKYFGSVEWLLERGDISQDDRLSDVERKYPVISIL